MLFVVEVKDALRSTNLRKKRGELRFAAGTNSATHVAPTFESSC